MKKYIIIAVIVLIIVAAVALAVIVKNSSPAWQESLQTEGTTTADAESFNPSGVSVAIADLDVSPQDAAELLKKRLDEIGFSASIIPPDPAHTGADYMTVLYRPSVAAEIDAALGIFARTVLIRKFEDNSQPQDIVIAVWSADDIKWGNFEIEAREFTQHNPTTVSVIVVNAGAPAGEARELARVLVDRGYPATTTKNSDTVSDERAVIYYRRNFRQAAKELHAFLITNGYADATYRLQNAQDADLVIRIGGAQHE